MITEDFCSFEVARLLKEKGFEQYKCRHSYDSKGVFKWSDNLDPYECSAPSHAMAMKWLREEKRTSIIIEFDVTKRGYCPYVHQLDYDMDWVVKWRINIPMKYEEAVETALKYSLENLI